MSANEVTDNTPIEVAGFDGGFRFVLDTIALEENE